MELFLNFIWMLVSLLLIVHWTRAAKTASARQVGKAAVALILLIVVLLPVISATDDLITVSGMFEGDHVEHSVRRGDMPLLNLEQGAGSPIDLTTFAILFIDLAFFSVLLTRVVSRPKTIKLLDGFVRATGIRPPPVPDLVAA